MNIIVVDDEKLASSGLVRTLSEIFPKETISSFYKESEVKEYISKVSDIGENISYAFLDIELRTTTGFEVGREIRELFPDVRIIMVTAYNNYARESFKLGVNGYVVKPASVDDIVEALDGIGIDWRSELDGGTGKRLKIVTFGNFDVYVDDIPLKFERSKSKELLALLVNNRGKGITNAEIEATLWEDSTGEKRANRYVQKVISVMNSTLKEAGVDSCIVKMRNYIALKTDEVDCDYYEFLKGNKKAIKDYRGEYMSEYSWAEDTAGFLTSESM